MRKTHGAPRIMCKPDHSGVNMSNGNSGALGMRELEVFASVMATGSMTGAARKLGIGQPAVTRMIRDLEQLIGFPLFQRNGPRITPTEKGLAFFEEARRLLDSYDAVVQRAAGLREGRVQSLSLAATPAMAAGLVPDVLARLGDLLPATLNLQTMDAEHVARALHSGAAAYGFSALPLSHADVDCLVSARSSLVAVLPEGPDEGPIPLDIFAQQRLLTVGNNYRIRHAIDAALEAAGVTPAAVLNTNSSLNAVQAAVAGLGIALVDCVTARGIAVGGARVVPLQTEIPYEWGLFRRGGGGVPEIEAQLVEAFEAVSKTR